MPPVPSRRKRALEVIGRRLERVIHGDFIDSLTGVDEPGNGRRSLKVCRRIRKKLDQVVCWRRLCVLSCVNRFVTEPKPGIGDEASTYRLRNGKGDTVLAEKVLHVNRDPEVVRKALLYTLSCKAPDLIDSRGVSKPSVARLLKVHPAQLHRLLDQTFHAKTIDQMVRIFAALGEEVEITIRNAA